MFSWSWAQEAESDTGPWAPDARHCSSQPICDHHFPTWSTQLPLRRRVNLDGRRSDSGILCLLQALNLAQELGLAPAAQPVTLTTFAFDVGHHGLKEQKFDDAYPEGAKCTGGIRAASTCAYGRGTLIWSLCEERGACSMLLDSMNRAS